MSCVVVSAAGERAYRPGHVYESIMSDTETSWRYMMADDLQRPLASYNYNLLTDQMSPYTDTDDQRKASTLPWQYERSRSVGPKLAKTETGSVKYYSEAGGKCRKGKLAESPKRDLRLPETGMKAKVNLETESTVDKVTAREAVEATKKDEACEPVGPVFRPSRRSRPGVVAGRRSSVLGAVRRGKSAVARKGPSSGRVPPVGAAAKTESPAATDWMGCLMRLDSKDSDEDSYVTACNSTPLLARAFPPARKDRATQYPDNRKSIQTKTGRRRRRRLRLPIAHDPVRYQPSTLDHPEPQITYAETTPGFVPIPVIIFLLCLYVICGATMFRQLYGAEDWSLAAFVSLAAMLTVGGWYPDRRTDDNSAVGRWISWPPDARFIYALWVVGGLAVISACIRLTIQTLSNCSSCCRRSSNRSHT